MKLPDNAKLRFLCQLLDGLFKWAVRLLFIAVLAKLWNVLDVYDVEKKSKPKRGMIEVRWEGPKGPFLCLKERFEL